jgi:hypothetical protein
MNLFENAPLFTKKFTYEIIHAHGRGEITNFLNVMWYEI